MMSTWRILAFQIFFMALFLPALADNAKTKTPSTTAPSVIPASASAPATAPTQATEVVSNASRKPLALVDISGTINPGSAAFLEAAINEAQAKDLQGLIIRLDTPGGLLSSTRDIVRFFSAAKIPVIILVGPGGARATSAGAIITVAAHYAAMVPGTNIGAAAPVMSGGKDIEAGDMAKKAKNDTAAMVRAQADVRGRNATNAEKMVIESLSHSPEEAVKLGIVNEKVPGLNELLRSLNGKEFAVGEPAVKLRLDTSDLAVESLVKLEMTLGQKFLHFIADPNISTVLMAIGGMAIYAEVSSGFTLIIPGVIGVAAMILAFVSLQALPINVGGLMLFVVGFVMLLAEAFVTSFGLLAVGGIAAIAAGALFLIDTTKADIQVSFSLLVPILAGIAAITGLMGFILARERKTRSGFNPFVNSDAEVLSIEADGRTGTIQVAGEIWKFRANGTVNIGEKVRLVKPDGLTFIVEKK